MMHQSLLRFRGARYFWWALALTSLALILYATPVGWRPRGGGTWQGYTLGTVGAALIIWLTLLGIRKRRYASTLGSVQGWTSAHVMLGLALAVVVTLHTGFQFGWNVHTLAYVFMMLVIASGVLGLVLYMSTPRQLSENAAGQSRQQMFGELLTIDGTARDVARKCDPSVALAVTSSIERTAIGGGAYSQLFGTDRSLFQPSGAAAAELAGNRDNQAVIDFVAARVPRAAKRVEAESLQELVALLCRRQALLRRIRRDIRLQAWLTVWLYLHIPMTVALLTALTVHVLATFMYW
jgi:hypothetical protein